MPGDDLDEDLGALVGRQRLAQRLLGRVDRAPRLVRAGLRDPRDELAGVGRAHLDPLAGLDPFAGDEQLPFASPLSPRCKPRRLPSVETPDVKYARSGDVAIAYQVVGSGALDFVFVPDACRPPQPGSSRCSSTTFLEGLARSGRVLLFDKRGSGLSDPVRQARRRSRPAWTTSAPSWTRPGSERAVLWAPTRLPDRASLCGHVSRADERSRPLRPDRRGMWAPDYPWATTTQDRLAAGARPHIRANAGATGQYLARADHAFARPSRAGDEAFATGSSGTCAPQRQP